METACPALERLPEGKSDGHSRSRASCMQWTSLPVYASTTQWAPGSAWRRDPEFSSSNPIDNLEVVKLDTDRTPIILPDTFRLTQVPDGRHYQYVSRTPDSTPLTYWYHRFHFVDMLRSSQSAVLSSGAPRHLFSSYSA